MEMMGGSAQSAVDSLLGRLSSVLVEEAQLLRGVHDDVQFIKREMESMNGFLLDASEASCPSNQVRAWTRQVHELAFDSQCCLDRYVQTFGAGRASAGLLASFRQLPKLVRTVSDRHRIATQIRELKARALEVGDRCARYGVATAARGSAVAAPAAAGDVAKQEADDVRRRRALAGATDLFNTDVRAQELVAWLRGQPIRRDRRRHLRNQAVTVHHLVEALMTGSGSLDDLKMEFLKLVMELLHHDNPGNVAEAYGYLNEIMKEVAKEEVKVVASNILDFFLPTDDKPSSQAGKKFNAAAAADLLEMVKEATEPMEIARAEARYVGAQLLWLIQVFIHKFMDELHQKGHSPKVLAIVAPPPPSPDDDTDEHHVGEPSSGSETHATELARKVYEDAVAADHFKTRVWVDAKRHSKPEERLRIILQEVLRQEHKQLGSSDDKVASGIRSTSEWDNRKVKEELRKHLTGKRFLIVLTDPEDEESWWDITSALPNHGDSAVVITPYIQHTAQFHAWHTAIWFFMLTGNSSRYEVHFCTNLVALRKVAAQLVSSQHLQGTIYAILKKCHWDSFATMMFLKALYANPRRSKGELEKLLLSLRHSNRVGNARSMIIFSLEDLPTQYQRCLLCLNMFPQDAKFKRTRLVRRWAAQSFITGRDGQMSAVDEAERCFDALIARGLLLPAEVGPAGKVKTCTVHPLVFSLVTKMASDVDDIDGGSSSDLPHDLALRLSTPRTGVRLLLQEKHSSTAAQASIATCWGVLRRRRGRTTLASKASPLQQQDVVTFLNLLPASSSDQLGLVKVLDLEGCRGLKKQSLKKICDKIFQLRYLSLRDTDATELPKEIDKLRYLETLDIRQTKISSFPANTIALPKLIHLLAGQYTPSEERGDKSFSTVRLPRGIGSMTSMQVLSHVEVSQLNDVEELTNVGRKLLQLRKLGVVIRDDDGDGDAHLLKVLRVVGKLHECLCSLSIHVEPASVLSKKHRVVADHGDGDSRSSSKDGGGGSAGLAAADPDQAADLNTDEVRQAPPTSLASLLIKGRICGLPAWIKQLPRLFKVTLWCTYLKQNDVRLLGQLVNLRCVRLWANSYKQKKLAFMGKEFRRLEVLVVEGSDITDIYFDQGAAPKLEKIAWTSTGEDQVALFGIANLQNLTEVELNGKCDPSEIERVQQDMKEVPNRPKLTGTATAAFASASASNISVPK